MLKIDTTSKTKTKIEIIRFDLNNLCFKNGKYLGRVMMSQSSIVNVKELFKLLKLTEIDVWYGEVNYNFFGEKIKPFRLINPGDRTIMDLPLDVRNYYISTKKRL